MSKTTNSTRHQFLLTYFDKDKYSFKEVSGFILEKRWNGNNNKWEVAIYTPESWDRRNCYRGGVLGESLFKDM